MDHKWLEDFVALARERSFSRAAQQRHVTQPQFSRRIRQLEIWAGADLVNRAVVPLTLTPAGEELLPVAHRSVAGLGDARQRIRHAQSAGDWVTLATGRTLSRTVAPAWLARLRRSLPGLRMRLVTGAISEAATLLEQGSADFLLTYTHPRLPLVLAEDRFEALTFCTEELVPVSAPRPDGKPLHALPGTARKPVPWLAYSPTLALSQILQEAFARGRRPLHLYGAVESDFAESLHELAVHGAGLAWLPLTLVDADLRAGRLARAGGEGESIRFEIRLYRPRAARNDTVQRIWAESQSA